MTQALLKTLSNYQNLEQLLKVTAETARKALKCDRVIVYSVSELPKGIVIAESVDAKYASILGKKIQDPFLEGEHLEMYCYGRGVVIDNVYRAYKSKSNLKDLGKLEIKSLAIAPILERNKLLALLVAHQCSEIKPWQSEAVIFLKQIATTAGFALLNISNAEKSSSSKSTKQTAEINKKENSQLLMEPKNQIANNGSLQTTKQETIIQNSKNHDKNRLFSDLNEKIADELNQEDIFETTVSGMRHLLECDRIIVYSLDQDSYGMVVAESVTPAWTKALGKTIDDPCFAARYIDKYRNGRVRAWNNVYDEDTTPCYLEQLISLQVKAKLVAPIVNKGNLLGLLIAHQCSNTRNWQQQEIHWITEIATQVGLMLEYTKIFAHSDQEQEQQQQLVESENQWNQHFTDAIQHIRQFLKKEDVLEASVKEVRRVLECDRVVVYSLNEDNYGMVVAESVAAGLTRAQGRVIKDPCFEAKYLDKYRNGRVRAWSNIYEAGMTQCYIEQLEQLGVKANLVTPIINEGKLFGLLVAHQCFNTCDWQQQEIRWVAQIATQVGFALDNAQLLADAKQLQHELENEAKLTKYFTDATRYIRESLYKEDILEVSVEEVRRVLKCDRVVVYSMNQDDYGTIVAESVAPGWTRSLGRVINDPCLKVRYIDHYRSGRVRAWGNIYESGLTKCYIEQLEQLEVKANLAIPIISEGQLFGLLFAHQCSDFREWQQQEIRWVTQIATQVGFALDNAQLLADSKLLRQQVESESKWTDYFTDATQNIRQSLKQGDILKTSVREVRRILECDRVVVYSLNQDNHGMVIAESVAAGWTRAQGRVIKDPCFEAKYLDKYRNGRVRAWSNIYEAGMTQCYIEQLEQLEVKANLVTPIINEGKLFGLLVAHHCQHTREWQQQEILWVAQIATQVGFALDNAKLLEQLEHSTKTNNQISHQQHEQTESLKHQVVEILAENGNAYQILSQEATRQSETTINVLHQIQGVADSVSGIALNVQQVKFQEQQNDLAVRATQDTLDQVINSVSGIQRTVQNAAAGLDNISHSSQQLSEVINLIKDLSKQIVQQSMTVTRAVNRSQMDEVNQNSMIDLCDTIFSLMQQLFEATARVEPLFAAIKAEVREKTVALDSGTQQLISGVGEFQTVRQKLDRVISLNTKMSNLIDKISQAVENQSQSSTFAKHSVQEVAGIAERISEHSMTITQSFNQLIVLVQKL